MYGIECITVEGPDLAGKSSLIKNLHRTTNYRWNIHDRSYLSRVCCAMMYARDKKQPIRGMWRELSNLNNIYVVLLPPIEDLQERLKVRGDDIQTEETLPILHGWFETWSSSLERYPNVIVIRESLPEDELCQMVLSRLNALEEMTVVQTGEFVRDFVRSTHFGEETIDLSLRFPVHGDFSSVLRHPREKIYYQTVMDEVTYIIQSEMSGINEYQVKQDINSRRFYYSSSSCLASVHFMVRDGCLKGLAALRSTDVDRNAAIDLKFLCHLMTSAANIFDWPVDEVDLRVRFNCAHVRKDLPAWNKDTTTE